jgi:hypothetical protein
VLASGPSSRGEKKNQDTVWLSRVGIALTPPGEGVADFTGIGGSFRVESVAVLLWNWWQLCYGISGNIRPEYAGKRLLMAPVRKMQDLSRIC